MKKILLFFLISINLFASVGKIIALRGDSLIISGDETKPAYENAVLNENDKIVTKKNAKMQIQFIDNTIVTLGRNTTLDINKYLIDGKNSKVNLAVNNGEFKVISGEISKIARENFEFQAKTATIGIRGTVFVGNVGEKISKVGCLQGAIDVKVGNKSSLINAGKQMKYSHKIIKVEKLSVKDFGINNSIKQENKQENKQVKVSIPSTVVNSVVTNKNTVNNTKVLNKQDKKDFVKSNKDISLNKIQQNNYYNSNKVDKILNKVDYCNGSDTCYKKQIGKCFKNNKAAGCSDYNTKTEDGTVKICYGKKCFENNNFNKNQNNKGDHNNQHGQHCYKGNCKNNHNNYGNNYHNNYGNNYREIQNNKDVKKGGH